MGNTCYVIKKNKLIICDALKKRKGIKENPNNNLNEIKPDNNLNESKLDNNLNESTDNNSNESKTNNNSIETKTNNNSNKTKLDNNLNENESNSNDNSNESKLDSNLKESKSNNNLNESKSNNNSNESESDNSSNESESDDNSNEQNEDNYEYGTPEELEGIIDYLLDRKKFLENKYGNNFYIQNNDIEKPKSLKDYQLMIDKLSKEVFELEQINNIWKIQNKNTQINFFLSTGQIYKINVDKKTKLGDALKKAIFNEEFKGVRYTITMESSSRFTDDYFKNIEKFNFEKTIFLSGGKNVSEKFRNNEPVSSLVNVSNSPLSILVQIP